MATQQDLLDNGLATAADITAATNALACFDVLFGDAEGLDEAMLAALFSADPANQTQLMQGLLFCLTDGITVTIQLDKQQLAEAIQNADIDGDGDVAAIDATIVVNP